MSRKKMFLKKFRNILNMFCFSEKRNFSTTNVEVYATSIFLFFVCVYLIDSWFHGRITRKQAEAKLMKETFDGAFLVRESESTPGIDFWTLNRLHVYNQGMSKYKIWKKI